MTIRKLSLLVLLAALFAFLLVLGIPPVSPLVPAASADLFLNEIAVRDSVQSFEVWNGGVDSADVTGYVVRVGGAEDTLSGVIPPGGRSVFQNQHIVFFDDGAEIAFLQTPQGPQIDGVAYGNVGGAPLAPHTAPPQATLARWQDGADTDDDAADWTVDFSPTLDAANAAPQPVLGRDVVVNEIRKAFGRSPGDTVELFNPTGVSIPLSGWLLSDGDAVAVLSGTIGPGGYELIDLPPAVTLESNDVLYLFDASEVRVDQKAVEGTPGTRVPPRCLGRFPDGAPPFDGWSFETSGGGETWFEGPCTLGGTNLGPTGVERVGWGGLKGRFR